MHEPVCCTRGRSLLRGDATGWSLVRPASRAVLGQALFCPYCGQKLPALGAAAPPRDPSGLPPRQLMVWGGRWCWTVWSRHPALSSLASNPTGLAGRLALRLVSEPGMEPMGAATCRIDEAEIQPPLESDEILVKDYSENQGMVQALLAAGIAGHPDPAGVPRRIRLNEHTDLVVLRVLCWDAPRVLATDKGVPG